MSEENLTDKGLKKSLIASAVFHVCLVIFMIVGLPHFKKDVEIVEPVPIDMIADISELTSANKPPVKAQPVKEPKKEEPPPPKKEVPKPPPKTETQPPDQKELEKPEPTKEEKEPDMKDILDELAPPKKEDPKPKPPEPKKEKPPEKKPEKPKEDKSEDFDALLKNLSTEVPQPDTPDAPDSKLMTEPEPAPNVSNISDVLSMSEMDALRQQLAGCWNIMSGASGAEDLAVEVKITVNPDRTVASANVVDQSRYNSDTYFRAMAESALRAVKNPRCSPLRLPEDKYNLWRSMTIVFDPKEMF